MWSTDSQQQILSNMVGSIIILNIHHYLTEFCYSTGVVRIREWLPLDFIDRHTTFKELLRLSHLNKWYFGLLNGIWVHLSWIRVCTYKFHYKWLRTYNKAFPELGMWRTSWARKLVLFTAELLVICIRDLQIYVGSEPIVMLQGKLIRTEKFGRFPLPFEGQQSIIFLFCRPEGLSSLLLA